MFRKWFKMPKLSMLRTIFRQPSNPLVRKLCWCGMVTVAVGGAFWLGRHGGLGTAQGQSPLGTLTPGMARQTYDPNGHVVAYIFGDTPITREELGEYLIQRVGAERIEFLVNRKIIERACASKNIQITDAEINAQYTEELAAFQCNEAQFYQKILLPYKKTLYEWKEDVIRPKLALERYVRDSITIDQADIEKAYEAKFGPKVDCKIIVVTQDQAKDKDAIWKEACESADAFDRVAKRQPLTQFASVAGKIPPIHKHFPDPNVEQYAFKLKPGETSQLIPVNNTMVVLYCVGHIAADTTTSLDKERMELHKTLFEGRVAQQMRVEFEKLRQIASPQVYLRRESIPPVVATGAPMPPPQSAAPGMPQQPPGMANSSNMPGNAPAETIPLAGAPSNVTPMVPAAVNPGAPPAIPPGPPKDQK